MGRPPFSANRTLCFTESARAGKTAITSRFPFPRFTHAPEYPGDSFQPYPAEAGQSISIRAELSVTSGNALRAFGEWITHRGGLPEPNPPPRSFTDEVALCRTGFLGDRSR